MKCICGSDVLLHIGGKTYCGGCFHAGIDFTSQEVIRILAQKKTDAKFSSFEIRK
jgi:hypothetical protein